MMSLEFDGFSGRFLYDHIVYLHVATPCTNHTTFRAYQSLSISNSTRIHNHLLPTSFWVSDDIVMWSIAPNLQGKELNIEVVWRLGRLRKAMDAKFWERLKRKVRREALWQECFPCYGVLGGLDASPHGSLSKCPGAFPNKLQKGRWGGSANGSQTGAWLNW